jgi:hypothetical protein
MRGDLRGDDVRDELLAGADHGGGSFIAGAFDAENVGGGHGDSLYSQAEFGFEHTLGAAFCSDG